MSTYTVCFVSTASTTVDVEADDPDEAIDKACQEVYVSICHQCNRNFELSGDWEPESAWVARP